MRFASVLHAGEPRWGVVEQDTIGLAPAAWGPDLGAWLQRGGSRVEPPDREVVALDEVTLRAPIPEPRRNIICLGLNYRDHAAEVQGVPLAEAAVPEQPMFFTKATTTVAGPHDDIVLDPEVTRRLDWEVELAVVLGRGGRHVPLGEALDHVFGYTVINDLSARDLQKRHGQFFLGKSMDGTAPMGPELVAPGALPDPHDLGLECRVNGTVKQASTTAHLVFGIAEIITVLSRVMTLLPGDIIATGTPGGVGFAREPREFLQLGDEVACRIAGIGSIRNRLVAPPSPAD